MLCRVSSARTVACRPDSFYDRIKENRDMGLHTLCLLDIRVKEPDMAAMCAGKVGVYEPPRYMSNNTCIEQVRTNALSDVFDSGLTRPTENGP
jgi:diphthamide biosynthesis methyltransferase